MNLNSLINNFVIIIENYEKGNVNDDFCNLIVLFQK